MADVPMSALRRLPFTTWLRIQRAVEGSDTACLLTSPEPLARSAGGLTLTLRSQATWAGASDRSRRLSGVEIATRIVSPRRRFDGEGIIHANAQCPMLNAQCSMPNAQSPIANDQH
jgi:hypothetical protein